MNSAIQFLRFSKPAKIQIIIICLSVLFSGFMFSQQSLALVKDAWRYKIQIKNSANSLTSNFTVDDLINQKVVFTRDLSEVYTGHYHNSEFHDGQLYVIHRTGGDSGYKTNPNWTDSLWAYIGTKQKRKIYSRRGLDFRASDDNQKIAVYASEADGLVFLSNQGNILKKISSSSFGLEYIKLLLWDKNYFWISEGGPAPGLPVLIQVNTANYTHKKYNISKLGQIDEYSFNPTNGGLLIYSDYPLFFDAYDVSAFRKSKTKVTLYLYQVKTKQKNVLAISNGENFMPKWINNTSVIYTDNKGKQRKLDIGKYL